MDPDQQDSMGMREGAEEGGLLEGKEGGSMDDDEQYFDDNEIGHLPADHPLMSKMQKALQNQLSKEHERVDLNLKEREEEMRNIRRTREETGVKLYQVQHQLAKIQLESDRTHDNFNIVVRIRTEAEKQHDLLSKQHEQKKEEVEEQLKKVLKAQEELNQLNRTLKQVEDYNEQMKSTIQVTKTNTYTQEEQVQKLEIQKKKQDLLVDKMNEEIKRLNEEMSLYKAQLISQREETTAAKNTLQEAALEIERIKASMKTLLDDWNKSLHGMQCRDNAYQSIREAIAAKNNSIVQLDSELRGIKNEIRLMQEKSEKLHDELNKHESNKEYIERRKAECDEEMRRLEEQMTLLKKSKQSTEEECARMDTERGNIQDQKAVVENNIMKLHTETKELIEDILGFASQQTTIEKSSANLIKQTKNIFNSIFEKQVELQNIENEIARVRIDVLNTESQNEDLNKQLQEKISELKSKEGEVTRAEDKIKKTHDEIGKKQLEVDKLNKKLDDLKKLGCDENLGPLEAERNNYIKKKNEKQLENERLQREWMKKQTEFVTLEQARQKLGDELKHHDMKKVVLEQKKMRIDTSCTSENKEIKQLEIGLKSLQNDMRTLNDRFSDNNEKQQKLNNENFNLENEFVQRLKQLENESLKLETNIQNLKESKADTLAEIVESERQILLWERKIQLEKEMQDALDPNIGQQEIVAMKKEIHIMELRYQQLRRRQEEMIKNIERAVENRETIQLKYLPKVEKRNAGKASQSRMAQQIAGLSKTHKHTMENKMQLENSIQQKLRELDQLNGKIEESSNSLMQMENDLQSQQVGNLELRINKQRNMHAIVSQQALAKKYEEVATNRLTVPRADEMARQTDLMKQNEELENILRQVVQEKPQFEIIINPLLNW